MIHPTSLVDTLPEIPQMSLLVSVNLCPKYVCVSSYALTTCLLKHVNFRLRDIHIHILRYNGPCRKGACSGIGTGSCIGTGSWIGAGNKWLSIKIGYFFIKATKAAGQSRLSNFEAVECSKICHS